MNIMPHITLIVAKGQSEEDWTNDCTIKGFIETVCMSGTGQKSVSHERKQREREHTDSMAIVERINVTVETNVINGGKNRTCWHKYPRNYGLHTQMRKEE